MSPFHLRLSARPPALPGITDAPEIPKASDPQFDRIDNALFALTQVAQRADGFALGITLTIGGAVVSGTLVGRNAWLDALCQSVAGSGEVLEGVTTSLRNGLRFEVPEDKDAPDPANDNERFIHLVNARFFAGNNAVPWNGALWRGRLESVDGWSPGSLQ